LLELGSDSPLAIAAVTAIHHGDTDGLKRLLTETSDLATARLGRAGQGLRTLLHIATDWPGHFPNGTAIVAVLVDAGADVNAPMIGGTHNETPLHWAASSDDVAVLDALLDRGADIEARGAVIADGTPLADAVAFGQWKAARRLIERGAKANMWEAAALGLMDRLQEHFAKTVSPTHEEITNAFWCACHGGQRESAEFLLKLDADINWVGHDQLAPLDAASRSEAKALVEWLTSQGGQISSFLARRSLA
jgi:uncharacterized protein